MDIIEFLRRYVSFESISSDHTKLPEMEKTRKFLKKFFESINFAVTEIPTQHHSVIVAKNQPHNNKKTITFYGHYDVQPVEPLDLWESEPFYLTEKDARLYARGASDNKGAHSVILYALKNLHDKGINLPFNVIFLLEGEEEIGSQNMFEVLENNKDFLKTDLIISTDTCSHNENQIIITTGLRGLVTCEVSITCNDRDIHSGYGGPIVNPIQILTKLCSSLYDKNGHVTIKGFYDNVEEPLPFEEESIKILNLNDEEFKQSIGAHMLQQPNIKFSAEETFRFLPSLEFNGITGGHQGEGVKTIIPSKASVKLSCRLVPGQNPDDIKKKLQNYFTENCPQNVHFDIQFECSSKPYTFIPEYFTNNDANDFISNCFKVINKNIIEIFGKKPLCMRDGGSIGVIQSFKDILGVDSILIGMILPKDTIHSPNESCSKSLLFNGVKFFEQLLLNLGNIC